MTAAELGGSCAADWEAKARGLYEPPPGPLLQSAPPWPAARRCSWRITSHAWPRTTQATFGSAIGKRAANCSIRRAGPACSKIPLSLRRRASISTTRPVCFPKTAGSAATYGMGSCPRTSAAQAANRRVVSSAVQTHQKTAPSGAWRSPACTPSLARAAADHRATPDDDRGRRTAPARAHFAPSWARTGPHAVIGLAVTAASMACRAMDSPSNHEIIYGLSPGTRGRDRPAPRTRATVSATWVHWVKTDNPNSLYDPDRGHPPTGRVGRPRRTYSAATKGPTSGSASRFRKRFIASACIFSTRTGTQALTASAITSSRCLPRRESHRPREAGGKTRGACPRPRLPRRRVQAVRLGRAGPVSHQDRPKRQFQHDSARWS